MSDPRRVPADLLDLAEAVVAGRITMAAAEATVRADDGPEVDRRVAELGALCGAARAVGRHAAAYRGDPAHEPARSQTPEAGGAVSPRSVGRPRVGRGRATRPVLGLLSAAAVLTVALVGGLLVAGVRSPGPGTSLAPEPTGVSADPAIPPIASQTLEGAPVATFWSLSAPDRLTIWTWRAGAPLEPLVTVDTWEAPSGSDFGDLGSVERAVLVAPDGRHIAVVESMGSGVLRQRLRVFAHDGSLAWQMPEAATTTWAFLVAPFGLAWSSDGRSLAIGTSPWWVVHFDADGKATATTLDATTYGETGYGLIGFSADASRLYGYETLGEAEFWQKPVAVEVASGRLEEIDGFVVGAALGLASSNATFPLWRINATTGAALIQALTAKGDQGWSVDLRGERTSLDLPVTEGSWNVGWGVSGNVIAVSMPADPRQPADGVSPAEVLVVHLGQADAAAPVFVFPSGDYAATLEDVAAGYVLLRLAAPPIWDSGTSRSFDEAVLVRTSDGATCVVAAPDAVEAGDFAEGFAGWVAAP